jgi:hypothetical protein
MRCKGWLIRDHRTKGMTLPARTSCSSGFLAGRRFRVGIARGATRTLRGHSGRIHPPARHLLVSQGSP